jgi:hypothetical protein
VSIASSNGDSGPAWFTSSYSNGAGGECVECALTDDRVLVRDSKNAGEAEMAVRGAAWAPFVCALKGRSSPALSLSGDEA